MVNFSTQFIFLKACLNAERAAAPMPICDVTCKQLWEGHCISCSRLTPFVSITASCTPLYLVTGSVNIISIRGRCRWRSKARCGVYHQVNIYRVRQVGEVVRDTSPGPSVCSAWHAGWRVTCCMCSHCVMHSRP